MILLAALLAAQSATGDGMNLKPATADAIVAGGKACLGTTIDPAGQDARLTGWTDATGAEKAGMHTEGRVVTRDNVMLIEKPGIDNGCVVMARAADGFDKAAFLTALGSAVGAPVATDPKNPVTSLPNGELLVTQIGDDKGSTGGATFIQLVVANPNGKHAKQSQGN